MSLCLKENWSRFAVVLHPCRYQLVVCSGSAKRFGGNLRRPSVVNGFFYCLHGCDSSFCDTRVLPRPNPLLCCFCLLDFQVPPQGSPLQAATPKHAEGRPLPTTDAARALTTMTSPNRSPPRPHRRHQAATRKVSPVLGGGGVLFDIFLTADPVLLGELIRRVGWHIRWWE